MPVHRSSSKNVRLSLDLSMNAVLKPLCHQYVATTMVLSKMNGQYAPLIRLATAGIRTLPAP